MNRWLAAGITLVAVSCSAGAGQHAEVAGSTGTTEPLPPVQVEAVPWRPLATTTTTVTVRRRAARSGIQRPAVAIPPDQGDVFWRLAVCESGGDPTTNTGNGYYGAFQFSLSTWRSVGGEGYPHHHSYEVQRAFAIALQARSGWGQWPACSRRLGLR